MKKFVLAAICFCIACVAEGKLPNLTPEQTHAKALDIMHGHATFKTMTPALMRRVLVAYLDEIDPSRTYFLESDIKQWLEPSDVEVDKIMTQFNAGDFSTFEQIQREMKPAIERHHRLEAEIDMAHLPKNVKTDEFKDIPWAKDDKELLSRLEKIKALQEETTEKMSPEDKEKAFQRITKRQMIFENEMDESNAIQFQRRVLVNVLKATATALDTHTAYFTPEEAEQFMINVQQRLFGIGAQLRDDINGFTVVKLVEGGPAARGKDLKLKDRIIAVNGEPVVGMDIVDAVGLIRGKENTDVILTVVREVETAGAGKKEEVLNIKVTRGEVVLKETRYESVLEPFGDGAIGYLRLFSFYQDPESSSGSDLHSAIDKLKEAMPIKGIILDLRYNAGGLLSQAVEVAGLFIGKGVVVSIKDENGVIQHLRHLEEEAVWKGPLIVLINRSSASAAEIVAGTLQDYGRAIIVGDDHTFGKGSYQTFTLNVTSNGGQVNPEGEYKVTRGRYYTVSGRTPQLVGVKSDILAPGILSELDIGEQYAKFPLESDTIPPSFDDDLSDIPANQREKIRMLYKFNLQKMITTYQPYLPMLISNSAVRIANSKTYQEFLKDIKAKTKDVEPLEEALEGVTGKVDLQLNETYNIMRDLLYLMLKKTG